MNTNTTVHQISDDGRAALGRASAALLNCYEALAAAAAHDPELTFIAELAGSVQDSRRTIEDVLKPSETPPATD